MILKFYRKGNYEPLDLLGDYSRTQYHLHVYQLEFPSLALVGRVSGGNRYRGIFNIFGDEKLERRCLE